MRVERLVIEAGENTLTLDLHPRLTVVAGMGRVERESLVGELIGALGGTRPGLHLELEDRRGRHLAVFRPTTGRHRIVDVDRARDVTAEFTDAERRLQPARPSSTSTRRAPAGSCASAPPTWPPAPTGARRSRSSSSLDQRRVWAAAERPAPGRGRPHVRGGGHRVRPRGRRHDRGGRGPPLRGGGGRRPLRDDPPAHLRNRRRLRGLHHPGRASWPGPSGFLFVAIAARRRGRVAAGPRQRRAGRPGRGAGARGRRGPAATSGSSSSGSTACSANDANRKALMDVAGARRAALAEWQQLAGDIPVEWALANREEIEEAARLRREVDALGAISSTAPEVSDDVTGRPRPRARHPSRRGPLGRRRGRPAACSTTRSATSTRR